MNISHTRALKNRIDLLYLSYPAVCFLVSLLTFAKYFLA